MNSKNKGITLIALVITIVVLVILSAVSIRTLGGENGLITKTQIAKEESKKSEYKDKLLIAKTEAIVIKDGQDITLDEYIEQIKADKIEGIKSIEKITEDKARVITKEGYIFIITVNTIEYYENENSLPQMDIKDANIEFTLNPNTWTNGKVEVTVSKKESKYTIQLSKDKTEWTATNKMTFEENGTIYARLVDEIGRLSDVASKKIDIIDKEKPDVPAINVTSGTVGNNNYYRSNVTVKITAGKDTQSGVNKTTYVLSGSTTKSETTIPSNGTIIISNEGTTTITAYTYDNANNKSSASTLTIKKDATPPTIKALFSENTTQALVRLDLKDNNGVKSIKVGSTTTDTKNNKNWIYDMYTSTDGSTKITVTDVAGNTTTRTHNIKFLYTQNNLRTENTGGWNENYYINKYGYINDVTYSSNGGLFILANPTKFDQGRLGTWYTANKINFSGYDTIRSVSWLNKDTTGFIQLGLGEDIKATADLNAAKLQNDYDGSAGYWTRLQADISSRNDSEQIVIGTNGDKTNYIHMFLTNMYMYSFK